MCSAYCPSLDFCPAIHVHIIVTGYPEQKKGSEGCCFVLQSLAARTISVVAAHDLNKVQDAKAAKDVAVLADKFVDAVKQAANSDR